MADEYISGSPRSSSAIIKDLLSTIGNVAINTAVNTGLNIGASAINKATGGILNPGPSFGSGGYSGLGGYNQVQSIFGVNRGGLGTFTPGRPTPTVASSGKDGNFRFSYSEMVEEYLQDNPVLKYFMNQMFRVYDPDINGFTFVFLVPPDLSGYRNVDSSTLKDSIDGRRGRNSVNLRADSYNFAIGSGQSNNLADISRFLTFSAIDFTPPASTVNTANHANRVANSPYPTEVNHSDSLSLTCIDNYNLDVYTYHLIWTEYMRDVLDGYVKPSSEYMDLQQTQYEQSMMFDYMGAAYIVKYLPNQSKITYACKCIGIFPTTMPSKELIGTRGQSEITTLPITYSCAGFREATIKTGRNMWIFEELTNVLSAFGDTRSSIELTQGISDAQQKPYATSTWKDPNKSTQLAGSERVSDNYA
jgi:hypothetical protein